MTQYTTNYALPYPETTDRVAVAADVKALADKTALELGGLTWKRGGVSIGTDLNTVTEGGVYPIGSPAVLDSLVNAPEGAYPGVLEVLATDNGIIIQRFTSYSSGQQIYLRTTASVSGGTFGEWITILDSENAAVSWDKGRLDGGSDLNTVTESGTYQVNTGTDAAANLNMPPGIDMPGHLEVFSSTNGIVMQRYTPYGAAQSIWIRITAAVSTGEFNEWVEIVGAGQGGGSEPVPSSEAGITNALLVQDFSRRRGGRKKVDLPVLAFRFDHGLANFDTLIRAHMERLNIPYSLALCSGQWDRAENVGVTPAMVNDWVVGGLAEIWNHTKDHGSGDGSEAQWKAAILDGKTELETQIPDAWIDGFAIPGSAGTNFGGFNNGSTIDEFYNTDGGRFILANHAVSAGYIYGDRILDGGVRQGLPHITLDQADLASVQSWVSGAQASRTGLQFMLHPSLVNDTGYMTDAQFVEILEWVAAERDAGRLLVMGPYDQLLADITAPSGAAAKRDTGWQQFVPSGPVVDPAEPGVYELRRIEDEVFCRLSGIALLPGAANDWLAPNGIPPGYAMADVGMIMDVPGGYSTSPQPNRATRHRISVLANDIAYVGYIHNWDGVTVEPARDDGTRRIYGVIPSWITDEPFPA